MTEPDGPFYDDRVHVLSRKCDTCIFRPGNLMDLDEGRVEGMAGDAVANQAVITCHDTIHRDDGVRRAVCRGFYDVHGGKIVALRLALAMNVLTFVDPPSTHPIRLALRTRRRGCQAGKASAPPPRAV